MDDERFRIFRFCRNTTAFTFANGVIIFTSGLYYGNAVFNNVVSGAFVSYIAEVDGIYG